MKYRLRTLLFLCFSLPLPLFSSSIVAVVNDSNITSEEVDAFVSKSLPGANYSLMNGEQKQKVLNQLIDRSLYLNVAKQEQMDQDHEYQKALEKLKENLMLDIWMKKRLDTIHVSEQEIRHYYRLQSNQYVQSAGASARHILVGSEVEALNIIQDLQRASNLESRFIQLAQERSTGPSGVNGGDLGWFNEDQMVPEFSQAALALQVGEITKTPVKTHFGYHIIYLMDKRSAGVIPYQNVRENIRQTLKLKKFKENLESLSQNLRKSAKIIVK